MSIFTRVSAAEKQKSGDPAATIREQALRLAAEGRFGDAIALATLATDDAPDGELQAHLVDWRRRGFLALPPAQGRADWPPALPDPFPGQKGPPEIEPKDLTAEVLGGAILHHGCLLVRGLVPEARAEARRADIDRAFVGFNEFWDEASRGRTSDWYRPFPETIHRDMRKAREFVRQGEGVWTVESPRVLRDVIADFKAARVDKAIEGYLGEPPAISLGKSTLRRVPITSGQGWHQDGSFMGTDIRTVNVWLALSHCGVDAPSLDIVPRRIPRLVPTGTPGAWFEWSVAPDVAEREAEGVGIASPVFAPGDALLFDQFFLHTTAVRPEMTKTRYAIESWFFAPSAYARGQLPLLF